LCSRIWMPAGFVSKEPRTGFLGQLGCQVLMPITDIALLSGLKPVLALLAVSNSLKAEFSENVLYFCTRRNILFRRTQDLSIKAAFVSSPCSLPSHKACILFINIRSKIVCYIQRMIVIRASPCYRENKRKESF
jgi:hypothetical protein